jgi:HK97 family phage portal protein
MNLFQKIKKAFKVETKPSSFLSQLLSNSSAPARKGAAETIKSYKNMPWFRAANARVSKSIASVTWELYALKKQGKAVKVSKMLHAPHGEKRNIYQSLKKEMELVEIDEHPLLDLVNECNREMTGSYVRQLTQIYLDSVGEAFWIKERNGLGVPVEIWPIHPTWVTDLPTKNNPYFVVQVEHNRIPIPPTEIIWFKEPDPEKPYSRGSGLGMALGDELDTDEFAAQHTKAWFYNRARPDLLVYGDGLQPADTQRMEQEWLKRNQGFWKAFKPFFVGKKIEVKELSQSFSDMDLIPLRKYERDIIIQTFGVTPEILGIIENSNRATIEAASYIFALYCLVPRLETLREYLQMFLVPDFDDRIIIDYVSPVAEDKEYQLRAATVSSWALTKDEWREMAGKEPLPDDQGKVFMVPAMLMEVPLGEKKDEPIVEEGKAKAIKSPRPLLTEEQEIKRWNAKVKGWDNWEGKWKRELKKFFQQQQDEVLAKLRDQKAVQKISIEDVLFERAKYNKLLTDLAMPLLISILEDGAEEAAETIGFDYSLFDVTNPHVQEWVGSRLELIKDINDTTRDLLKETLKEGIGEGETISQLSERVTQVFSQAKGYRAEVISRTETIAAYVQGNVELYREAGIKELEFFTAMDERVCEECYSKHGNTYKVKDSIGVIPVHPQCRCDWIPVIE